MYIAWNTYCTASYHADIAPSAIFLHIFVALKTSIYIKNKKCNYRRLIRQKFAHISNLFRLVVFAS